MASGNALDDSAKSRRPGVFLLPRFYLAAACHRNRAGEVKGMDEYYEAIEAFPPWLAGPLSHVLPATARKIHEVRLRIGCPILFTIEGEAVLASACCPQNPALASMRIRSEQMDELLFSLCDGSVHSYEEELGHGFLTLAGGHRVGIGGRFVTDANGVPVLQHADSFNLRIARYVLCDIPPEVEHILAAHFIGLLIAGEPDSGKTTLLRSIIPILGRLRRTTVAIDERCELLPDHARDLGCFSGCDRIAGIQKATAIEMALRSLGPQVILLDELGSLMETHLLEQGFFSGVDFIATVHAASLAEAETRPQVRFLLEQKMLSGAICLKGRKEPGVIAERKDYHKCCI